MNSLANSNRSTGKARDILSRILKVDVVDLEDITKGKNSLVYKVRCSASTEYAAKFYFQRATDANARLLTEFNSLKFLWQHNVRCVPRTILANEEHSCGVYELISGAQVLSKDVSRQDIDQLVNFLLELKDISMLPASMARPAASECCLSVQAISEAINRRIARLWACPDTDLRAHLKSDIEPNLADILKRCQRESRRFDVDLEKEIDHELRTLSPSDLGFHNAIMRDDGILVFLDLEYFGWDDPAKMISDFLWHPGSQVSAELQEYFVEQLLGRRFGGKVGARVRVTHWLHGINWCLRMLNDFLPAYQQTHPLAGEKSEQWVKEEKTHCIKKSQRLLDTMFSSYEFLFK